MIPKKNKKVYALYLSVAFFFAFFSFGKIYASNDEITPPTTVDHVTYPLLVGAIATYDAPFGGSLYCFDATWYAQNSNSEIVDLSRPWFALTIANCFPSYTGEARFYFGTSTSNVHVETYQNSKYVTFYVNNGTITNSTSITSVTPSNRTTLATSSSYTFGYTGYLDNDDFNNYSAVKIHIENSNQRFKQCADVVCAQISDGSVIIDHTQSLLTNGAFSYSSTTSNLPIGKYYMTVTVVKGDYCIFGLCVTTQNVVSTSTTFTLSTTTKADALVNSVADYFDNIGNATTTTDQLKTDCSNFDISNCLLDLILVAFYPDPRAMTYLLGVLHDNALTHFPIGYVTDFISIMSTTTTGTLTVIDATLPMFGNPHVHIDLTNSIDYVLNATTSQWNNASATSTDTFYDITNYYWKIILYLLALFYIIGRILGSHLFGGIHPKKEIK